jgi:hypothetical protein
MADDPELRIRLRDGQYRGKRWDVFYRGHLLAGNMRYEKVRPLILFPEARREFLARYGQTGDERGQT